MSLQQRQPERTRVYGFQDPSHLASQPSFNTCLSSAYLGGCSIELSAHLTTPLQTVSFRYTAGSEFYICLSNAYLGGCSIELSAHLLRHCKLSHLGILLGQSFTPVWLTVPTRMAVA